MSIKTGELLIEILSEEIPARMQQRAIDDFKSFFKTKFEKLQLPHGDMKGYISPRRMALVVSDLAAEQPDTEEEKRGPREGAPDQAIQGFLKSSGLSSLDECEKRETPKGTFYIATIKTLGRSVQDLLPELIQEFISTYTWPKSMRWMANQSTWVRPLQHILCLYDGKRVSGTIDLQGHSLEIGDTTVGHRFHHPDAIKISTAEQYISDLRQAHVIVDHRERRDIITKEAEKLASQNGQQLHDDAGLITEVTGLVEWPVMTYCSIDQEFMDIPQEVLITAMRVHQRYFALEDSTGRLAPNFIVAANISAPDGGKALTHGYERVLRARLADAKFFWDLDRQKSLDEHGSHLDQDVFFDRLGMMDQKVARLTKLAENIAAGDTKACQRAAQLCKADLCTEMVGEFPELQGIMGYYYALHQGESTEIAEAIADHYLPKGNDERLPRSETGKVVALADKIDTLVGFFAIGVKPTGSKDPYALRRAAIGIIRLLEGLPELSLTDLISIAFKGYQGTEGLCSEAELTADLTSFFLDRLKVFWREQGLRHDHISAVVATDGLSVPLSLLRARVEALHNFMNHQGDVATSLLTAYRRASNIVSIEEKKDATQYNATVSPDLLVEAPEKKLFEALSASMNDIQTSISGQDYEQAMTYVAGLRPYIDAFFDQVTVNADNENHRHNRLRLLSMIRTTLHKVADFSKLEG
ncbi:MAG: glycine--tRNA ligase subunit beta [Alphaproteobacteria bacterium]